MKTERCVVRTDAASDSAQGGEVGAGGKMENRSKRKLRDILRREKTRDNQHRHHPTTGITLSGGREQMYRADLFTSKSSGRAWPT